MNRCSFGAADLARIDRLAARVRAQVGTTRAVPRAALLRALLQKGLELAETREITGDCLSRTEPTVIVEFRITSGDSDRLVRLRDRLQTQRPFSALPALTSLERALILIALSEVETQAAFPRFSRDVLLMRHQRGNRGHSRADELDR